MMAFPGKEFGEVIIVGFEFETMLDTCSDCPDTEACTIRGCQGMPGPLSRFVTVLEDGTRIDHWGNPVDEFGNVIELPE